MADRVPDGVLNLVNTASEAGSPCLHLAHVHPSCTLRARTPVEELVPLSEEELRLLEQMERALVEEDPKFASTLRGTSLRRSARRRAIAAGVVFVLGIAMLMGGVMSGNRHARLRHRHRRLRGDARLGHRGADRDPRPAARLAPVDPAPRCTPRAASPSSTAVAPAGSVARAAPPAAPAAPAPSWSGSKSAGVAAANRADSESAEPHQGPGRPGPSSFPRSGEAARSAASPPHPP